MKSLHYLDIRGVLALFGSIICWGFVPVMLRELTHVIDPWTANGIRFPLAAMFYWPVLITSYRRGFLTRHVLLHCLPPAACLMIAQVLWATAPYYLPASTIGFMARMTMVFAILLAMIFIPEERRLLRVSYFYFGLIMTVLGFFLLSAFQNYSKEDIQPVGVVILLFYSLCMGLYTVSIRFFLQRIHPLLSFGVVAQFVSIGVLIMMGFLGDWRMAMSLHQFSWFLLVASSLLGVGLGHILLYTAIRRLGASISSGVQNLTPLVTALLASIFLSEVLSGIQWIGGMALVVGAVWLINSHSILEGKNRSRYL